MKNVSRVVALLGTSAIGVLVLVILAILVRGLCLSILWGWLIVPVFGLPALTIAAATGLTVFTNLLLNHAKADCTVSGVFVNPLVVPLIGWIVHLFI